MASNFFAKSASDANARKVAEAASYYFLGRVSAKLNDSQLRSALAAEQKALRGSNMNSVMQQCTRIVRSNAERVQNLGLALRQGK
jgi:hypothetical protein